ncbi:hypothetical protein EYF80_035161 [Liparis tanakae]|uniref:Uncharacterized protein n=1 Tax=Liparis tanakae TaxID=230148 RepID=A0A4Z2GMQ6_9TELE|nr:hypothetical protein EYF80_035161 [Liparis tanakae]
MAVEQASVSLATFRNTELLPVFLSAAARYDVGAGRGRLVGDGGVAVAAAVREEDAHADRALVIRAGDVERELHAHVVPHRRPERQTGDGTVRTRRHQHAERGTPILIRRDPTHSRGAQSVSARILTPVTAPRLYPDSTAWFRP